MAAGIIEMELSGRGNGWTVIDDVIKEAGISWHRGLPGTKVTDVVAEPGTLYFTLDNSEKNSAKLLGYYSPDHANKRVGFEPLLTRVRYRIGSVVRFIGTLEHADIVPGTQGPRRVSCEVLDWIDIAARVRLFNLPILINFTGDEVFQVLIDSLDLVNQPDAVEKDTGTDIFPYTLDTTRDEQTILRDELYRLCTSGLDKVWVRGDGTVVYESRTRRAIISSDVDTFTDANAFIANRGRDGIVNRVHVTIHPRLPSLTTVVLYSLKAVTPLIPGQSIVILGPWTDPDNQDVRVGAIDLTTVTSGTDYTANTLADGSGTDLTSSVTVSVGLSGNATEFTVSLSGSAPSGYLTKLQQRGKPLYDYGPSILKWEDTQSVNSKGVAALALNMQYQADPEFAIEVAQYVTFTSSKAVTQISGFSRYIGMEQAAELARSVNREISDRIRLTDPVTGVNRSFFINAIDETEHDGMLKTEWTLAPADSTAFWLMGIVGRSEPTFTTRLGFGLVIGHTDIAHGDEHGDVAHLDTAHTDTHTDNAHQDTAHGDGATHGDTAHTDSVHQDTAHTDVEHVDSHNDVAHVDVAHVDSHSDVAHADAPHEDFHLDTPDIPDEPENHGDYHEDYHLDTEHSDSHSDTAHSDTAHSDTHSDTAHSDVAHVDTAHVDTPHDDSTSHSDAAHTDAAHGDVAHQDVLHADTPHEDTHTDSEHGDLN
jgi:hypothetical protein